MTFAYDELAFEAKPCSFEGALMFKNEILRGEIRESMSFCEKVWALTARIPEGKVTTYGHIARHLGSNAYRAVGLAMNRNPYAPAVPCHRVVGSQGALTGFAGGLEKKKEMLTAERVPMRRDRVVLADSLFTF